MSVEYETDYEVGQDNVQVLGMDMHNPVFFISAVLILAFVIGTIIFPAEAKTALDGAKCWTISNFDWLFMVGANIFVLFCIALIFLPVGKIRLGGKDARPDFSTLSWFAMLFAAGMGIGLMFWSVAEPVGYYTDWFGTPLNVEPNTPQAKDMALGAVMWFAKGSDLSWTADGGWSRAIRLSLVVLAGIATYFATLFALGFRPRDFSRRAA